MGVNLTTHPFGKRLRIFHHRAFRGRWQDLKALVILGSVYAILAFPSSVTGSGQPFNVLVH